MNKNSWNYKYALPAVFYAILIFTLSSLPSDAVPTFALTFSDVFLHFVEYLIFGYFVALGVMQFPNRINWKNFLLCCLIGFLYAASDEYHQSFVESRYSEFSDFLADSVGVIAGAAFFVKFPGIFPGIFRKFSIRS